MINLFDIICILLFLIFGYIGYRRGIIGEASKLLGLILGLYFAMKNYQKFSLYFDNFFQNNPGVRKVLGFLIIFLVVYFLIEIGGYLISKTLQKIKMDWINRSFGGLFGFLKAGVLVLAIVWGLYSFQEEGIHSSLKNNSITYSIFNELREVVSNSFNLSQTMENIQKNGNINNLKKTQKKD